MAIDTSTEEFRLTEEIQREASNPRLSAWVSANAGSGKTHVLTNRVIRLLMGDGEMLRGADPASILCITYTKAAAAEMQARLFKTLGDWALMDDAALIKALNDRLGEGLPLPTLGEVRRLFARALGAPGGLRIQTIHAFCESLLRRFPVEAGLLPGFVVLEDAEVADIINGIGLDLAREAADAPWGDALLHLIDAFGDLDRILSAAREKAVVSTPHDTPAKIRARLGLLPNASAAIIKRTALDDLSREYLRAMEVAHDEVSAEYAESKQKYDQQTGVACRILAGDEGAETLFDAAAAAWLKADGTMPSERTCGGNAFMRKRVPPYKEQTIAACEILAAAVEALSALRIVERTEALLTVAGEVNGRYVAAKSARGALDFDDLIARAADLVETHHGDWIRYRLDQGITHLLLDEAQDTGAQQWSVIKEFRNAFWQGVTDGPPRTAFVVGDKKQSIYSFQGADARLFEIEKRQMQMAADGHPYAERNLFLSFRSASSVLRTVDAFFEGPAGAGLYGEDPELHAAAKPTLAGQVELWPMVRHPEASEADIWSLPVDSGGNKHPYRRLSEEIAEDITRFIREGTIVDKEGHARRPGYGDIMILCQRRTGIFPEIVRTLSLRGIPNGGTDRVRLKEDVAVRDLQAALRFAVNHDDHLSLAELLKSPFGRFDDDDLFRIAYDRGHSSLWAKLREARDDTPLGRKCADITARIEAAEQAGRRRGAFAFLSCWLEEGAPTGRQLLRARLGDASDDALDELLGEALTFDTEHPRTLDGFLAYLERLSVDIKKELGEGAGVVRIMTVHGAKGLEAPVVYLADAGFLPGLRAGAVPLLNGEGQEDGIAVRVPSGIAHPAVETGKDWLRSRDLEEYRRKFYVAATRAEQRLVICATEAGRLAKDFETPDEAAAAKPPAEASWYGLAMQAFERLGAEVTERPCGWREDAAIRVIAGGEPLALKETVPELEAPEAAAEVPGWLFTDLPKETPGTVYFPSALDEEDEGPVLSPRPGGGGPSPRERGLAIHELLELLPLVPAEARREAADRVLARSARDQSDEIRAAWRDEVLAVLDDPRFGNVFGPDGEAEVGLRGRVGGRTFAGQVDRLLITPDEVLVVDYKTMRPPPDDPASTPAGILRQMAIYRALLVQRFPDRPVRAAILWTYVPRLMQLPEELLAETVESMF